jgi:Undecaprenyl-phosphate glucose phosphotransferase
MLKKHARFFCSLFILSDFFILSIAWILSYFLRFYTTLIIPPSLGIPPFSAYVEFLFPLWLIWALVSNRFNLYRARRIEHFSKEFFDVAKSLTFTFFILIATSYLLKKFEFSRLAFFYFLMISFLGIISVRFFARKTLMMLRRKGYNRRFALIAGTGELGRKTLQNIEHYQAMGIQVIGFLTHKAGEVGKKIRDIPILGVYADIRRILGEEKIDIFFVALSINEYHYFESLIKNAQGDLSEIKVVPASYEFLGLRGGMDALGDLPIVNLQSSPLYGWDSVFKRMFDLILGTIILLATAPLMLIISSLIKLTSEGPILYRQGRMGMDGRFFQMLKFRTMRKDAEKETGPIWAKENDPRRTGVGAFLRKTSLDELPQLFNVLKGEMSLVGPRPERPDFVKEFKDRIPPHMLRHKIKAGGMTGWAQVNGWKINNSQKGSQSDFDDELVPPLKLISDGSTSENEFKAVGEGITRLVLIERARLKPNEKVLDVGCGIGRIARPLTKYLSEESVYEGFDIVSKGIVWCKEKYQRYQNFHFHLVDIYNKYYNPNGKLRSSKYEFPYADDMFDLVVLLSVFTHMLPEDMKNFFKQIARVLKPHGRCVITYFLLNQESLACIDAKLNTILFPFEYTQGLCRIADQNNPELVVAYYESFIKDIYMKQGLSINEIIYGFWSGRKDFLNSLQDVIIAVK